MLRPITRRVRFDTSGLRTSAWFGFCRSSRPSSTRPQTAPLPHGSMATFPSCFGVCQTPKIEALPSCASADEYVNPAATTATAAIRRLRIRTLHALFSLHDKRTVIEFPGVEAWLVVRKVVSADTTKHSRIDE